MSEEATLDEFIKEDNPGSQAEYDLARLEKYISIIKGTKPEQVIDELRTDAEPYLVVSTLTGEEQKYTPDTDGPKAGPQDILMIMDGSKSGRVYRGKEGVIGSTMAAIRPEGANSHYLRYFLESNFERLNSATKGSAVPHTDKDLLRSLEIPIYPLAEQRKIATVLYTVEQTIEKTEEIKEQIARTGQALRQNLFTEGYYEHKTNFYGTLGEISEDWETTRLHKIAEVARGKFTHRPRGDPDFYGGDYPFIQTGEVVEAVGEVESYTQTLNEKGKGVSKSFDPGTILLSITGRNTGATAVSAFEVYFPDSLVGITPYSDVDERFLEHYLRYRREYLTRLSTKTTQKNLNLSLLRPIEVVKPPLDEQEKIADVLTANDEQLKKNKQYLNRLQHLKRGLMQDLLSGKVRTTDTNIEVPEEIVQYG